MKHDFLSMMQDMIYACNTAAGKAACQFVIDSVEPMTRTSSLMKTLTGDPAIAKLYADKHLANRADAVALAIASHLK